MKIVVVIPIRGGSKGLSRKNIYKINGTPLLGYAIDTALPIADVWVATEDKEMEMYAISKGVQTLRLPEMFVMDDTPMDRALVYFSSKVAFDTLVIMQATSPMTRGKDLERGIKKILFGCDSVLSVINTNDILIWDELKGEALNYSLTNRGRRQDRISMYSIETGGFYITTRKQLEESRCRLGGRIGFVEVPYWSHFQVDSLEDAEMIGRLMEEKKC